MDTRYQHVFIVRAVENADLSVFRNGVVNAPQIIVTLFGAFGLLERGDGSRLADSFRVKTWLIVPSLPAGVDTLQDDQQGALSFGIEEILQRRQAFAVLREFFLGVILLDAVGIGRVDDRSA